MASNTFLAPRRNSARRIKSVEHQVDDDARDRDVEPERVSPARDAPVAQVVAAQRTPERDEDERHNARGQRDVRDENREIERAHEALPLEAYRAVLRVIDDVRDEEEARDGERRKHASAVRVDPSARDEVEARDEQDEARGVQGRVQVRQYRVVHKTEVGVPTRAAAAAALLSAAPGLSLLSEAPRRFPSLNCDAASH